MQHITNQPLMFASNLRNEFAIVIFGYSDITNNFLLNNSDRSIPTRKEFSKKLQDKVFQSYQFRQINPDTGQNN